MKYLIVIKVLLLSLAACQQEKKDNPVHGDWIKGSKQEQLDIIEKQFRGFDMAMVETGYRYQELYWAGQDENWDYARYQTEKIRKAIENGLERRPKRAKSAAHFLTVSLPDMEQAIEQRDTLVFNKSFNLLTNSCNNCHAMEKVLHFTVKKPLFKQSPIRK